MNMWLEVALAMGLMVMRRFQLASDSCLASAEAVRTTSSAQALILSRVLLIR